MARRLVEVDVDADHEVERVERRRRAARRLGVRQHRVAGDGDQRADLALARASRSPRRGTATGSSPKTSGSPRTRLCQRPNAHAAARARARRRVLRRAGRGAREHRAAGAVEVAGEHVDHVDQPARERAELLRAGADAPVDRGALGAAASSRAMRRIVVGVDAAGRRDGLGRERRGQRARPRRAPSTCSAERARVDEALGEQHVDEREQQQRVGAGADEVVLVGLLGGARAARVDRRRPCRRARGSRAAARACRARSAGCRSRRAGWRRGSAGSRCGRRRGPGRSAPCRTSAPEATCFGIWSTVLAREDVAACRAP